MSQAQADAIARIALDMPDNRTISQRQLLDALNRAYEAGYQDCAAFTAVAMAEIEHETEVVP